MKENMIAASLVGWSYYLVRIKVFHWGSLLIGLRKHKQGRFKVFWHHLEFMSTILLNFGVRIRNWPRIDLLPSEFNFEFYFWRFFLGGGGGGGGRFAEFQQRIKILGLHVKLKTSSRSQKSHSK